VRKWSIVLVAGMIGIGIARAEVLEISGEFAAPNREASLLRSLSVDRISGQDGPALARAIEQGLGYFDLLGGPAGRDRAEGLLSGGVASGVEETGFEKVEKECVSRDKDDKCLKEEKVKRTCKRRVINVNADLRLVHNRDGRILYSATKPFRNEVSWCPNQTPPQTVEETISGALRSIAASLREDITPSRRIYSIRVRETTKGMSKGDAVRFKALVAQTKRDPAGACAGWQAMQAQLPGNASLLFNLGLCAEQSHRYYDALRLYDRAAQAGAREGREGAIRAEQLMAGEEDAIRRR
jgi:hypothetical protein